MIRIDTCSLKISLPVLVAVLVVAQIDFASAFGWPHALLSVLHLTPVPNDQLRGICAGIATSLDVFVVFQLARIWARRTMKMGRDAGND